MFEPLPARFDFPAAEKRVLAFWDEHDVFGQSLKLREGAARFVFYEGPPTANGMPHPGHCLTRVMKDIFPRYKTMRGFLVERKGGWDTHGLPVEREVCKELGIRTKQEIEAYGVEKFNLKCIQSVFRYTREWEEMTRRLAYWVDLKNAYVTYHQSYVESVWWSLKTLFDRGVLYQGHKVVWWWAQGGTALSSGEVGEGYKTVDDPSVFVKFPLVVAGEPGVLKAKDDPELNEQLVGLLAELAPGVQGDVTIDFTNAKFVTSASLGRLLDLRKVAAGGGCKLRLRGVSETLRRLFAAVALDKVFEIEPAGRASVAGSEKGGTGVPSVSSRTKTPIGPELTIRQRYLPHWEAGGSSYFVTFRTLQGELTPDERSLVLRSVTHFDGQRYLLHAAVVMPDHVHMLFTPLEKTPHQWWLLAELLHSIKSFTAHEITKARGTKSLWMEEYFDRIIRSNEDFDEKLKYILTNPDKRGLGAEYSCVWSEDAHASKQRGGTENGGTGAGGMGVSPVDDASPPPKNGRDARTTLSSTTVTPPKTSLLVWTTTPWTLVSNHFAAVHPDLEYALVHDAVDDEHLYVAAALVEAIGKKVKRELRVVSTCKGTELIGLRYLPPFRDVYYDREFGAGGLTYGTIRAELKAGHVDYVGWRVLAADFVTIESGTGLVHEAPAFGEVDFNLLQQERQRFTAPDNIPVLCAVKPDGVFDDHSPAKYRGRWVKECDKEITRELRDERKTPWGTPLLYHQEQYRHDYPFCPQAPDDPLIQYARRSWFVRTSQFKDEFLKNNAAINWLPEHIKEGRFGDFLRNNVDWALSRERYWGTPLPIWRCESCGKMEAIGSFAELQGKPGATDGGYWDRKVAEHKGEEFPAHLRVHKPYIDEWTYECAACAGNKGRMRRVPEVIDCWWDAGSMPFAQWGFPHADGSVETFAQRFPADFISEAIDQTRGWFYGLLAISTLLSRGDTNPKSEIQNPKPLFPLREYPVPFKTCIVLGHIAGEDGNKMSKKLRNYKEPSYIFDTLGADAMRWYFLSAQAPWTSTRFAEAAIRDSQREFLVKLYNVLSFFTIYASIDGFDPSKVGNIHFAGGDDPRAPGINANPMGWRPTGQRTELDRWIVTELRSTVTFVRESMDRFENYPAAQRLNDFVDALSNWYVRRSRDRFWRKEKEQEKWDAYHTLYGCLRVLSHLIAPFTPFFAENMHRILRVPGDPISIHLCDYPTPEDIRFHDDALAATMDTVRELVALGRSARTVAKLKVRQPLALVELILARPEQTESIRDHAALVAEELNVKRVELVADADKYVTYKVVPNFKAIGAKFRELVPKLKDALGKLPDAAVARRTLLDTGSLPLTIDGQTVNLTSEEVEIRLEAKPGWSAAQGKAGVVVLSTEITAELRDEGVVRELIHFVQTARKERNLPYEARIVLKLDGPEEFASIVRKFADVIHSECLVARIEFGQSSDGAWQTLDVEGFAVKMAISGA